MNTSKSRLAVDWELMYKGLAASAECELHGFLAAMVVSCSWPYPVASLEITVGQNAAQPEDRMTRNAARAASTLSVLEEKSTPAAPFTCKSTNPTMASKDCAPSNSRHVEPSMK